MTVARFKPSARYGSARRMLAAALLASVSAATLVTASAGAPQAGTISREEIALAADRIRADRWYDSVTPQGAGQAVRQNRSADMDLLLLALKQPFPELRAASLRELGRFGVASNAALLASYLHDPVGSVKRAAADAVVQTLWDKTPAEAADAVRTLDQLATLERSEPVMSSLWRAIAELPLDAATAQKYETRWINEILQVREMRLSAQLALVSLAEHRRGRPLLAATEQRVKEWARKGLGEGNLDVMVGTDSLGPTIRYLEILQAAQADADDIAISAATFVCRKAVPPFPCGSEIRRLGVELLNNANPAHIPALLRAARDRGDLGTAVAAIRSLIKSTTVTRCELLLIAEQTSAEADVVAALGVDAPERKGECGDWSPEAHLTQLTSTLMTSTRGVDWVVPAAALEALAKLRPEAARPVAIEVGGGHQVWQVRMAAARVARTVKESPLATKLAADESPNVRAAAIESLLALQAPELWKAAADALSSPDYHLVRTAALALKGAPDSEAALNPLFEALRRLTDEARDTSRRARLALIERIAELLPEGALDSPAREMQLQTLRRDFDPLVAKAAADLLRKSATSPMEPEPKHREAHQPTAERIRNLPPCVVISLEGEYALIVVLNRTTAPVAVARFVESVEKGYYTNATMFRHDENLTVFGNPGANDEGGWPRFARDEPGTSIRWLSLTLLNHGPDTADGRLALRWHSNPPLSRQETVLGQAHPRPISGALAEVKLGKQIASIAVGGEGRIAPRGPSDPCYPFRPW